MKTLCKIPRNVAADIFIGVPYNQQKLAGADPQHEVYGQSDPAQAGHILGALEPNEVTHCFLPAVVSLIKSVEQVGEKLEQNDSKFYFWLVMMALVALVESLYTLTF